MHVLALHRGHTLEELQIRGQDLRWQHVVGENVDKLILVLWLQQAVQGSLWEGTEGLICWSEHGEWSWRTQGLCKISCNNRRHQCGEIIYRLGQFNNVWLGVSERRCWWEQDSVNDVCHTVARQIVRTDN